MSTGHDDFPAILAEELDIINAHVLDIKEASAALGCTATQLTKLLKDEPRAFLQINRRRRELGLHPLQ